MINHDHYGFLRFGYLIHGHRVLVLKLGFQPIDLNTMVKYDSQ